MLQEYQLLYLDNDIPINRSFYCNNGDIKGRGLEVHVLDNSQAKDCTGLTLRMIIKVPSGDIFEATVANGLVTVLNAATGIYQILFPDNMGKGRLIAEIQISNAVPEVIVSRKFSLVSDGSLTSDGSISELPKAGILWDIIKNEAQRQADFEEVLNNADVAVAEKFANLETEYATDLTDVKSQLAETATLDKDFPRIAPEVTDSPRIQRAIESIKTTTTGWQLEAVTSNINSKKKILLPAGRLIISQTINLPSYINFEGAGRHTTILESAITDGSPVILLNGNDATQTHDFYNTLKGFSIDGKGLNCQGIKFNFAHRWLLDDVYIGSTRAEGLYFWESYLGDVRSTYVWACGNVGKPAVKLDGSNFDNASHGINFFGGEIVGSLDHGFYSHYGASISIFGTTIEGNTKAGIVLDTTLSTLITGCYLEENVNHIEVIRTEGATIKGNYFSSLKAESLGNIGITKLYGSEISSNTFANALTGGQYNLFAIGLDVDLRFRSSHILNNTAALLPIAVETRLLSLAKTSGSLIETDNLVQRQIHGKPNYNDGLSSNSAITSTGDISSTTSVTVNGANMLSGTSDPVGALTANHGSLYMRSSGSVPLYGKIATGTAGWRAVQIALGGDTVSRPTGVPLAFMYYDQTIQKPIWWNGTGWKDSTGTIV